MASDRDISGADASEVVVPSRVFLTEYARPSYLVPTTTLHVDIREGRTVIRSRLEVVRSEGVGDVPLVLDGIGLELLSVAVDGEACSQDRYECHPNRLVISRVPSRFILEISNAIVPENNTSCMGLYRVGSLYATQMEPEGFRRFTYFPDRPDVMSRYRVTVEADQGRYPVLLSNGNFISKETLPAGRHAVTYEDPYPKPTYLFALVAGDLEVVSREFITRGGRTVTLRIFVEKGDEDRVDLALRSLEKSMKWDEETFGLEYDLDEFNIVAVSSFNFGAMENKGLNIFNSMAVLGDDRSATDVRMKFIEGVVAHEYFHNWTGNRVTCRDWFQLTLKEGLTRYRDQEFSADMNSRALVRIEEVSRLRSIQFPEDAGPNHHPIRPASYVQVDNFYTSTVYDKGAEVIRMVETLVGTESFRKGITKYFELFDGQGVTTEDFLHAMSVASGYDLRQFQSSWYDQSGTPRIEVDGRYDAGTKRYSLVLRQKIPAEVVKDGAWKPYHLPFAFALLRQDGTHAPLQFEGDSTSERTKMLVLSKEEHTYTFTNVAAPVVPSLLRNFSAPVIVEYPYSVAELRFLLRFETDPYNRFEAGQRLAAGMILRKLDREGEFDDGAIDAFGELFRNGAMDPGFEALALTLPSLPELLRGRPVVDFEAAHAAREAFQTAIACRFSDEIASVYDRCAEQLRTARVGDGVARGLRALKNVSLGYLWRAGTKDVEARTLRQFTDATTMTDEQGALQLLVHRGAPSAEKALAAYLARWGEKTDVLPSWFSLQVGGSTGKEADVVERLAKHPLFDRTNPNLVRALYRGFAQNLPQFHRGDGRGYQLLADQIVSLDPINPTVASSLAKCFADYPRLDAQRRSILRACLHRISRHEGLSSGVAEVVTNTLSVSSS